MTSHPESPKIFLSYAAADGVWAEEFTEHLRQGGAQVVAAGDITWGQRWIDAVQGGLRESDVLVILYQDDTASRPDVLYELGAAMAGDKVVIPVVSPEVTMAALPIPVRETPPVVKESPAKTAAAVARALNTFMGPADRRAVLGL